MKRTKKPHKRKNIKKQDIALDILEANNYLSVSIKMEHLPDYEFPGNAQIFLEAYNKLNIEHIELGNINSFEPKRVIKKELTSFEVPQRSKIKFRLKIVDKDTYHLLGLAENLKEAKYANSLLSFQTDDKINTVFKVDYGDFEHPVLLINQNLRESLEDMKPFLAEAVFKEILLTLLLDKDPQTSSVDEEDLKNHKWIQFAQKYKPKSDLMTSDNNEKIEWINDVVDEFSKKLKIIPKLKRKLEGN